MDTFIKSCFTFGLTDAFYISAIFLVLAVVSYFVASRFILSFVEKVIGHAKPEWGKVVKERDTFRQLAFMVPVLFIYFWVQYFEDFAHLTNRILGAYLIINIVLLIDNVLRTVLDIYRQYPVSSKRPIKNYIQLTSLLVYIVGGVSAISVLLDKDPSLFLTTFGGATLVIGLVFRDTILSFIAGMQLAANNLVQKGDWIEVPKFGADGSVLEVALHVVQVQNWDKTIVTIPTYKLIEEGFKNWRGMYDSGGRRIKRAMYIDQNGVKFMDDKHLKEIEKNEIIQKAMKDFHPDPEMTYTNLGLFRAYVEAYLQNHAKISKDMTFIVRLLDPTSSGIPLEIYVFTNDTAWSNYEKIQASIFEHFMAIAPLFHLRIFQNPTGYELSSALAK